MLHSPLVPVPAALKQASALGLLRLASEVEPHIANRLKHLGRPGSGNSYTQRSVCNYVLQARGYACMYVCMYTSPDSSSASAKKNVCMYVCMYVCVYIYIYTHIYTYIYRYMCVYIYNIYIYIYIYI